MMPFTCYWADRDGNVLEHVERHPSTTGSVSVNSDAILKYTATLTVLDPPDWVDPFTTKVQIMRGDSPLGLYVIRTDTRSVKRSSVGLDLELVDPLFSLQRQALVEPFVVPAGANVVDTVADIIRGAGETRLAVTPSDSVTSAPQAWIPGDEKAGSLLTICNQLLGSINYAGLHTSRVGEFVLAPYVLPADRATAHRFIAGQQSLLVGEYSQERDYWDVPNRLFARTSGYNPLPGPDDEAPSKDSPSLSAIAENHDPNSPWSYENRGNQWVPVVETVEATTQKEIEEIAARLLAARTGAASYVDVQHAYIDAVWMNARVYAQTAAGDVFDCVVDEMTIPERGLVSAQWKQVTSVG